MVNRKVLAAAAAAMIAPCAWAAAPPPAVAQDALVRVVDVGAGLCVVAVAPGGHAMLYDAGRGAPTCLAALRELAPGRRLDLLVLSHSDSDHVRETVAILAEYEVGTIIHPGDPRGALLDPIRAAIAAEPGADVWNLATRPLAPGQTFGIGSATATFVAGWSDGDATRGPGEPSLGSDAMRNNALSTVIRFEYAGHSVLLTGDTVGRLDDDVTTACRYAERIMVENAGVLPLRSDVLVGQHHGANNATSNCFIRAVAPTFVVFSAGHHFRHPRQATADRLVAFGIPPANIFRTDRGDDEQGRGAAREWIYDGLRGCHDQPGDDDVEIRLPGDPSSATTVAYETAANHC